MMIHANRATCMLRHQGDLQNGTCFATRRATCKTVLLADAFMIDKVSR